MIYENKFGKIKIELENLNNKTIGIAMSGGADSTLLCCLLANTIKEKGLDYLYFGDAELRLCDLIRFGLQRFLFF